MSTIENRIDTLAYMAKAEAMINSSLSILELGCSIQIDDFKLVSSPENTDWNKHFLVGYLVRQTFDQLGVEDTETLVEWLAGSSAPEAIESSQLTLSKIKKVQAYRQNFIENFDRETMAAEYVDECTPTGDVHYRILYTFSQSKGIYTSERRTVTELDGDFWEVNTLWFDYYGPEEDEYGLIPYLDY